MPKRKKKVEKTKPYGWLWAIFLISGCMFIVGVLVGRGTAPVKFDIQALQNEIRALKAREKRVQALHHKIEPGFYEELKKPVEAPPALQAKKPAEKKSGPPAAVKKPSVKPSPTKNEKVRVEKVLRELGGSDKPLTIQVSSLKDHALAQRTEKALKAAGYHAYVITAIVPGKGVWHRVRLGAFADKQDAAPVMKKLKAEGRRPILVAK